MPVVVQQAPHPSINQATKHVETSQTQYTDQVVAVPIMIQRQVPQLQTVPKTGEAPQTQFIGNFLDVPVISQINQVTKHADIPQKQYIDNAAAVLVVIQRLVPRTQTVSKTEIPTAQFIGRAMDVSKMSLGSVFLRGLVNKSLTAPVPTLSLRFQERSSRW